jgi:hypothetical protein
LKIKPYLTTNIRTVAITDFKSGIARQHRDAPNTRDDLVFMKKRMQACGLFSEEIEGYGGIGQEFTRRLADQGYRYQFNPKAMIYHHGEFADDYGLARAEKIHQAAIN